MAVLPAPPSAQLPFDIWHRISMFIPHEELVNLYSVNQAFFRISMSQKYRRIIMDSMYKSPNAPLWHRIAKDQILGQYVRSLELREPDYFPISAFPDLMGDEPESEDDDRLWFTKSHSSTRKIHHALKYFSAASRKKRKSARRWPNFVSSLYQVTDLKISLWMNPSPTVIGSVISMLPVCMKVFGSNLRSLVWDLPITSINKILIPSLYFERLEDFSLTTFNHVPSLFHQLPEELIIDYTRTIAPFIKRHSGTLRGLTLISERVNHLLYVINDVDRIPNLQSLKIIHPCRVSDAHAHDFQTFLSHHIDTLTNISFEFSIPPSQPVYRNPPYADWFNQKSYSFTIPNLTKLSFQLSVAPLTLRSSPQLCSYIARHSHMLTELSILETRLTFLQVEQILDALASGTRTCPLRVFNVDMRLLTASVFELFSVKLPLLQKLKIGCYGVGQCPKGTEWMVCPGADLFEEDMRLLSLDSWWLEAVEIEYKSKGDSGLAPQLAAIEAGVRRSLPRVQHLRVKSDFDYR